MDINALNARFGIAENLVFSEHPSGLVYAKVQTSHCTGEFFLQGAHVTHYQDILFMSRQAIYQQGKALRGGIPICFPWFNSLPSQPSLPAHGWARTSLWQVLKTYASDDGVHIELGLANDGFNLVYRIVMGAKLSVSLEVQNSSQIARDYEVALHTYFRIGDIHQVTIKGDLERCGYYDQLTKQDYPQTNHPIGFNQETDRIYYGQAPSTEIEDRCLGRVLRVESEGSDSTVVWNPWIEKSKKMSDFGDDEYRQMCCIETSNVRLSSVRLEPGQSRMTSVEISQQPL
ncbi:MAG: D-hexose-6-phosphate mutarotase [Planctomycetota bacterium]|jgi:glucose-6-phosphate 1-epimerase